MTTEELDVMRYPIGKFQMADQYSEEDLNRFILNIEGFPAVLSNTVEGFNDQQLDTPYRPDGWTVRQLIHHIADSHLNSYIRFRWTMTEEVPTIKTYEESKWAELEDAKKAPVALSLHLLTNLHARWVILLKSFGKSDFQKEFFHPERNAKMNLSQLLALYDWHCNHHLMHIQNLKTNRGWA